MSVTVHCAVPGAEYDVLIGRGVLAELAPRTRALSDASRIALISDSNVVEIAGPGVASSLASAGFTVEALSVPAGETSKSWALAGELLENLAAYRIGRDDLVLALGGGVVGDLAGFVAATYLRGVEFVQVPTTLLAAVDSSVGGKTAVDLAAGKNLAGAFKQPLLVVADTALFDSLPEREWQSGLAEVAKSAVLEGGGFWEWMRIAAPALASREPDAVDEAVMRSVAFKAGVVARDEKEEGPRECLNYGHTLGHAIEKVLGYGTVTHGAAVAEGMRFAARLATVLADADMAFVREQDALLDSLGLPALDIVIPAEEVLSAMGSDKKVREGSVRFVLPTRPGVWSCVPVENRVLSAHVEAWAASKEGK